MSRLRKALRPALNNISEKLVLVTSVTRCQFALVLVLFAAISLKGESLAVGPQRVDVLPPPRSTLLPIHKPDLTELEPEVREQLISLQNSTAAQGKDPAITDLKLSEAYGLLGQVYHAYSLTSPARECYLNARQLTPRDFRWTYLLASVSRQEDRTEEAITYYKAARVLRPDYLAAPVNLGNLYLQ